MADPKSTLPAPFGPSGPSNSDAPKPALPPNYDPSYGAKQAAEVQRLVREGINKSLPPNVQPTFTEKMQKGGSK